jgi:ABC-2 type transport system ATP-binding protein
MADINLSYTETTMTDMVISLDGVTKTFGRQNAADNLTFKFPKGKIIGLIGPSGSGKTSTVRLMTGIYHPTKGQIRVLNSDPQSFTQPEREKIGYMTQNFVLYPDLSIRENLNFAAAIYGIGPLRRSKRIKNLLKFVELDGDSKKLAKNISGGMLRRLALAASLIHDPDLIFLDEPTAGIDPILRRKFWDHFVELRDQGKTLVVTTQYVNEATYCDLVGVMAEGKLLFLKTPADLIKSAFGGDVLDLRTVNPLSKERTRELEQLPFIQSKVSYLKDGTLRLIVDEASTSLPQVIEWFNTNGLELSSAEEYLPPYDDVFVKLIEDYRANNMTPTLDTGAPA